MAKYWISTAQKQILPQNYLQIFDWMPKNAWELSKNFSRLDSSFVLKKTCIAHCWKSVMVIKSRCKTIRVYFSTFSWFFFCSTNLKHFTAFENCANNNVKWKCNFFQWIVQQTDKHWNLYPVRIVESLRLRIILRLRV